MLFRSGGFEAKLILQVHDELIVEAPEAEAGAVRDLLRRCMERSEERRVGKECRARGSPVRAREMASASMWAAPRLFRYRAASDLPQPMPPVSPMT